MRLPERLTLDTARELIGRRVIYWPPWSHRAAEYGQISSVGNVFVHVRYDGDQIAKATAPDMLMLDTAIPDD